MYLDSGQEWGKVLNSEFDPSINVIVAYRSSAGAVVTIHQKGTKYFWKYYAPDTNDALHEGELNIVGVGASPVLQSLRNELKINASFESTLSTKYLGIAKQLIDRTKKLGKKSIPLSEVNQYAAENRIHKDDLPEFYQVIEQLGGEINFE